MNVWLLEVGTYSDARIVAAFDDEHKADGGRYAELIGGRVLQPLILNEFSCDAAPAGTLWSIEMAKDGEVKRAWNIAPLGDGVYQFPGLGKPYRCQYRIQCKETDAWAKASRWRLHVETYAENEKHAVKIANEIRSRVLAGALPLTNKHTDIDEGLLSALRELREEA